MAHNFLLHFDAWLQRYSGPSSMRVILILGYLFILIFYGLWNYLLDIAIFSPDSWAYYRLAGTVFEGKFFSSINRSNYLIETHSASVPLGYPVAVALVQEIVGSSTLAAVWLNINLAALNWVIGIRMAIRFGTPAFAALVLSTTLVLWPPYFYEVLAGRSIPLAIFWVLLALVAYSRTNPLLGGLFLGLGALTRFDFTVIALLFIAGVMSLDKNARRQIGWWLTGLLLGMVPWIVYSWLHFGRFWVSNNSWVALSALPAYVSDFPARASLTVFDAPDLWFARVLGNVPELIRSLLFSAFSFPPLMVFLLMTIMAPRHVQWVRMRRVGLTLSILAAASLTPYLLTGYFDKRYFTLLLLGSSLAFAVLFTPSARPLMHGLLFVALGIYLLTWGLHFAIIYNKTQQKNIDQATEFLHALHECHLKQPEHTLILFMSENTLTTRYGVSSGWLVGRYGAITGMKSVSVPNNFSRMSQMEKEVYFTYMKPFFAIDDFFDPRECSTHGKQ